MSAIGPWNNRYEGGPCYAACMETFTLYPSFHSATTPPSPSAGKAVTMELEESTTTKAEIRHVECVKDSPQKR